MLPTKPCASCTPKTSKTSFLKVEGHDGPEAENSQTGPSIIHRYKSG